MDGNKNQDADKNGQEVEIYEGVGIYDGDYEEYISQNARSSNSTNPQRKVHRTANKRVRSFALFASWYKPKLFILSE